MFCPICGNLSYTDKNHYCRCANYKCSYEGKAIEELELIDGSVINFTKWNPAFRTEAQNLKHLQEVMAPPIMIFDYIRHIFLKDSREMINPCTSLPGYR
ncbi:MAG: hypothetical protein ACJZ4Z_01675 [Candidatus Thalassarchaeaceae archaeon]